MLLSPWGHQALLLGLLAARSFVVLTRRASPGLCRSIIRTYCRCLTVSSGAWPEIGKPRFDHGVKPPSDNEDSKRDKTEAEIKAALKASSALSGVKYKVYAKG